MIDLFWSALDMLFHPPLCRLGFHHWEVPPNLYLFRMFPQHQDYQQCTRFGCWKKRDIEDAGLK
jgi:hypothetical protein